MIKYLQIRLHDISRSINHPRAPRTQSLCNPKLAPTLNFELQLQATNAAQSANSEIL